MRTHAHVQMSGRKDLPPADDRRWWLLWVLRCNGGWRGSVHLQTHSHTHTHTRARARTHARTHTHTYMHTTRTRAPPPPHTPIPTHARTHARACTHTHTASGDLLNQPTVDTQSRQTQRQAMAHTRACTRTHGRTYGAPEPVRTKTTRMYTNTHQNRPPHTSAFNTSSYAASVPEGATAYFPGGDGLSVKRTERHVTGTRHQRGARGRHISALKIRTAAGQKGPIP